MGWCSVHKLACRAKSFCGFISAGLHAAGILNSAGLCPDQMLLGRFSRRQVAPTESGVPPAGLRAGGLQHPLAPGSQPTSTYFASRSRRWPSERFWRLQCTSLKPVHHEHIGCLWQADMGLLPGMKVVQAVLNVMPACAVHLAWRTIQYRLLHDCLIDPTTQVCQPPGSWQTLCGSQVMWLHLSSLQPSHVYSLLQQLGLPPYAAFSCGPHTPEKPSCTMVYKLMHSLLAARILHIR